MDIVESQHHMFHIMGIEQSLAAMDAIGISGAVVDEYWHHRDGVPMPAHILGGGIYRPFVAGAELASSLHPDRFCHSLRIHPEDPMLATVVQIARAHPGLRALRCDASNKPQQRQLADGAYADLFTAAADQGLPVFVLVYHHPELIARYLEQFPSVAIIIDHCGLVADGERFDAVLRLAEFPNAYLKWGHARMIFGRGPWPYEHLTGPMRQACGAFGAERIMWAGDSSVVTTGESWAETLFYLRDKALGLSLDEQEWILGRTVRTVLNWPRIEVQNPRQRELEAIEAEYRHGPRD